LGLMGGVLMTMSRGPWIAGIFAIAIAAIGAARNQKRALILGGVFLAIIGPLTYSYTSDYSSVGRKNAATPEQETAAYRAELMTKYRDIALERPWLGWGEPNKFPVVGGMWSIDNEYLFLALRHGFVCVAIFALMFLVMLFRLLRCGLRSDRPMQQRSLAFALAGVIVAIVVSLGTVFLGAQLFPLVFIMVGWSEGCVLNRSTIGHDGGGEVAIPRSSHRYQFEKVYA
jgi:hypothetical protein